MCWSGKTNSGFYRDVNQIYFVTNGTIVLDFSPNRTRAYEPFQSSNGLVGEPIYSFATMNDGGLWRDSATDSLKMSVNGVANFVWEDGYNESLMPLRLASYATGSLPTASSHEGSIVYDSTTQTIKWSDGTSWATI